MTQSDLIAKPRRLDRQRNWTKSKTNGYEKKRKGPRFALLIPNGFRTACANYKHLPNPVDPKLKAKVCGIHSILPNTY